VRADPVPDPVSAPFTVRRNPKRSRMASLSTLVVMVAIAAPTTYIFGQHGLSLPLLLVTLVWVAPSILIPLRMRGAIDKPLFAADDKGIWLKTDGATEVRFRWDQVERVAIVHSAPELGYDGPTTLLGRRIRIWPRSPGPSVFSRRRFPEYELVRRWSTNIQFCDPSDNEIMRHLAALSRHSRPGVIISEPV
jgi:hypothetical protein